jgi:hypothetical protein
MVARPSRNAVVVSLQVRLWEMKSASSQVPQAQARTTSTIQRESSIRVAPAPRRICEIVREWLLYLLCAMHDQDGKGGEEQERH